VPAPRIPHIWQGVSSPSVQPGNKPLRNGVAHIGGMLPMLAKPSYGLVAQINRDQIIVLYLEQHFVALCSRWRGLHITITVAMHVSRDIVNIVKANIVTQSLARVQYSTGIQSGRCYAGQGHCSRSQCGFKYESQLMPTGVPPH
jgi:hypothetical protein